MLKKLWNDEAGIVTLEYLVLATIVGLGLIVGAVALRNSLNAELGELGEAIMGFSQAYSWNAQNFCGATNTASATTDTAADVAYTSSAPVGSFGINVSVCP
jgi:Flp pilus assembly pilin Flp